MKMTELKQLYMDLYGNEAMYDSLMAEMAERVATLFLELNKN